MPYNFAADSFHTKKLCSRLYSSEVRFYTENGRFALSPLRATVYNVVYTRKYKTAYGQRTMIILSSLESALWTSH